MKSKSNIAVVGSGYWGKNLIRNYHLLGALKVICDKDMALLNSFKQTYPDVKISIDLTEVLADPQIKGVVIATPAETHFEIAREALLSKKHVYVEKPLVLDEKQAVELIDLARTGNRVLMVGHLLQYHPAFIKLKTLCRQGELGRINYIHSTRLNLGKIRREENILWSFAPHDISMILALADEMPESVQATGGNYLHRKIADVTTTHLDFPSGLKAHIFVSWLHPFKEQKLVVVGEKQMAVFEDTKDWPHKLLVYPHKIKWENNLPIPERAQPTRFDIEQDEPLKSECQHFLECIETGQIPYTDGNEGLRVLSVLKASQLSLDKDGIKIALGEHRKTDDSMARIDANRDFIHPSAVVDSGVQIGKGTKIWHFTHILSGTQIGQECNIGQNVMIGPKVVIKDFCKIQNNVSVYQGVTLEEGVFCGPSMVFTNVYNPRAMIKKMDQMRPTLVKKGATIGANATIVCGVTIGAYAFIGAGTVVTKSVADHALIVGNPGQRIGWVCECGERLTDGLTCLACNQNYRLKDDVIEKVQLI